MNPDIHLDFLQQPPRWLLPSAFLTAALVGLISGLLGRSQAPAEYHTALVVLAVLAALVNAALTVLVYPFVFTALSRRLGAHTEQTDIRVLSTLCLLPNLLGLLLTAFTHVSLFGLLSGLVSTLIFVYGLSLANGTDMFAAFRHTLAIWGIIILTVIGVKFLTLL